MILNPDIAMQQQSRRVKLQCSVFKGRMCILSSKFAAAGLKSCPTDKTAEET